MHAPCASRAYWSGIDEIGDIIFTHSIISVQFYDTIRLTSSFRSLFPSASWLSKNKLNIRWNGLENRQKTEYNEREIGKSSDRQKAVAKWIWLKNYTNIICCVVFLKRYNAMKNDPFCKGARQNCVRISINFLINFFLFGWKYSGFDTISHTKWDGGVFYGAAGDRSNYLLLSIIKMIEF